MGSFNVGCGISNLSIDIGDKVGIVAIRENTKYKRWDKRVYSTSCAPSLYIFNTELFMPVLPPLFAEYDDCGGVTKIKETVTTKAYEALYRRPIEQVVEAILDNGGVYSLQSGVHRHYVQQPDAFKRDQNEAPISERLVNLGFTNLSKISLTDKISGNETCVRGDIYVFSDYALRRDFDQGSNIWSFYDLSEVLEYPTPVVTDNFTVLLEEFSSATGVYPGFAPEDYPAIRLLSQTSGMFFLKKVFDKLSEYQISRDAELFYARTIRPERKEIFQKFAKALKQINANGFTIDSDLSLPRPLDSVHLMDSLRFVEDCLELDRNDWRILSKYEGSDEFDSLRELFSMMNSANRMFMPSYNGEQEGNTAVSLTLNQITDKILKARAKRE